MQRQELYIWPTSNTIVRINAELSDRSLVLCEVRSELLCYPCQKDERHDLKTFRAIKFAPPSLSKLSRVNPLATGDHDLPRIRMRGSVPPLLHTLLHCARTTARSSLFATKTYRKEKQHIYLSFKKKCGEMEIRLHAFLTCAPYVCQ